MRFSQEIAILYCDWNEASQHSVEKWKIYFHRNFFSSNHDLVISLVKPLLSRKFCQKSVRVNLRNFHTVHSVEAYFFPAIQILRETRFSESKTQIDNKV